MAGQSAGTRSNTARIPVNAINYNVGGDDNHETEIKRGSTPSHLIITLY